MTRKKGVSIGAAMKQRMGSAESAQLSTSEDQASGGEVPQPAGGVSAAPVSQEVDPLESFNTRLPRSVQRRLKIHVAMENTKIQDVLHTALDEYLRKHGR